jgi:tetratricopeptide (TPR) repeat protein
MLKKNLITILFFIVLSYCTVLTSCKKNFLEVDPIGRLIAKTTNDYNNLFYTTSLLATGSSDIQITLSDEVAGVSTYLNPAAVRIQKAFRWENDIYLDNEDAVEFTRLTAQVYLLNKIANEVMSSTDGSESEKRALQAEALATMAWSYFMLINYYGKPYNPATAAADPGFPIVTEADAAVTSFSRASVQEVYDFIIKDLTENIPALPRNSNFGLRQRMNKSAAIVLLGKVYLFMGRYTEALEQLNLAATLLPTNVTTELYDYNQTLVLGGSWGYSPTVNSYTNGPLPFQSNEGMLARNFTSSFMESSNLLLLTQEAYQLYGANDQRKKLFTSKANPISTNVTFPLNMVRRYGYNTVPSYGITYPEYFLLRAECKARTNDLTGAKDDLETLRKKRMPAADAVVNISDRNQMIRFIINERQREFALNGYRWFDMRRLSVDPLFANDVYTHKIFDIQGNIVSTYTLPKERLTLRLPLKIMAQNANLTNNP